MFAVILFTNLLLISALGEFALIEQIKKMVGTPAENEVWVGDDAAVIKLGDSTLLATTDMTTAGVHMDLAFATLEELGYKAVATAVSDIAAMGGSPFRSLISVAAPKGTDFVSLHESAISAAREFGCFVVGGDISVATQVMVTVTVLGVSTGSAPVLRSGAKVGDTVFATGCFGRAACGLRLLKLRAKQDDYPLLDVFTKAYLRPTPKLLEGKAAAMAGATAMIDVSDGFSQDLGHIIDSSGVGIELSSLPVADGVSAEDALFGGEDYELVFCASDLELVRSVFRKTGLSMPLEIGVCTNAAGQLLLDGKVLPRSGFQHDI